MKVRQTPTGLAYRCPCGDVHYVDNKWQFNGDVERPTLTPSVLVTTGHYLPAHRADGSCWCTYNAENPDSPVPFGCYRCHSYVTDGMVQFLTDSTHALAGQTVSLENWERP